MAHFKLLLSISVLSISLNTCKSTSKKGSLKSIDDGTSPATADTSISASEETDILNAMEEARMQGVTNFGLDPKDPNNIKTYTEKLVGPCLKDNNVARWSDLVMHYYCQHGLVRKCFTERAKSTGAQFTDPLAHYQDTFAFCEKQASTDPNWQWLTSDPKRASIFKFIMFTNGRTAFNGQPEAFNQADQDRIINKFYGVSDPQNPSECHKRPRRNAAQEPDAVDQHCGNPATPVTPPIVNPPTQNGAIATQCVFASGPADTINGLDYTPARADGTEIGGRNSFGVAMSQAECNHAIAKQKNDVICAKFSFESLYRVSDGKKLSSYVYSTRTIGDAYSSNCLLAVENSRNGKICAMTGKNGNIVEIIDIKTGITRKFKENQYADVAYQTAGLQECFQSL